MPAEDTTANVLRYAAGQGDYHILDGSDTVSSGKFSALVVLADAVVTVMTPRRTFGGSALPASLELPVGFSMPIELTGMTITSGTVALAKADW